MVFLTKAFMKQISVEKHYFGLSAVGKIHKIAYLLILWQSITNLKSTRTPEQIEQLSFGAIGAKIPLYKPYEQKSMKLH